MSTPRTLKLIGIVGLLALTAACSTQILQTRDTQEGLAQILYAPSRGKAPIVVVLSGYSGTSFYEEFSDKLAHEGYYVVLLDGKDIFTSDRSGEEHFVKAIERAQRAPGARPGKAAVIGFSYGGAPALVFAANLPERVSSVTAYYPYTSWIGDTRELAGRFKVPILMLAGEKDHYNECCVIDMARAIEAAAKARQATFTLVTYPEAEHAFTLPLFPQVYRPADTEDAWRRTLEWLRRYQKQ